MVIPSLGGYMNNMMDQTSAGDKLRGNSAGRRSQSRQGLRNIFGLRSKGSSRSSSNRKGISNTGDIVPKGFSKGQLAQYTPEQMQLFQSMFRDVAPDSYLSKLAGGDESYFDEMEAPAWRTFQEAQNQLGNRYSQLAPGALSAQKGSGFQNAAGQLGSDFAMNLASRRRELQRQAISDLQGLSTNLLGQRPVDRSLFENAPKQEKKALGGWGGVAGAVGGGLLGSFIPGIGPMGGARLGSAAFGGL